MGIGRQLRYLLYRNYLLKRRNIKQTTYEVVSVLYFIAILALIRRFSIRPVTKTAINDQDIPSFNFYQRPSPLVQWPPRAVGYAVVDGSDHAVVDSVISRLNRTLNSTRFIKFANDAELERGHKVAPKNITMGLLLDTSRVAQGKGVAYTLKTPFNALPNPKDAAILKETNKCRDLDLVSLFLKHKCPANSYVTSGFSIMQSLVDAAVMEVLTSSKGYFPPNITLKMAPKGEYKTSLVNLVNLVSIYMVLAFSPYVVFLLTHIVTEKEKKIKEAMKIMGLNMYAFWLGWFITYAVVIGIGVIFVTIIAGVSKLFGDSDYVLIFIVLFLYGLSIETLSFMFTPLFTNAKTAGMAGSLANIILGLFSFIHIYAKTSNAVKWVTCLLSPVALSLSLTPAIDADVGLTWTNVGTRGDFPAAYGIVMLVLDVFLYLLIAVYLDAVFPGEYGVRKHPLFFLNPSFWRTYSKGHRSRRPSFLRSSSVKTEEPQADVEDVPPELLEKKVISIRKIVKKFKARGKEDVTALNGVSLDVYEGQITALLGHNGAGKSTLIALLTGLLPVTQGKAIIYGFNINSPEGMDKVRQLIGLCPQQNIIFEELTPEEHLHIFAGIKGVDPNDIKPMVDRILEEVDLAEKKKAIAKNLSGGQKRKLCVGIALIGDPKVVFLDEPTSGMDPSSRRKMWNLLRDKKQGRVIFLTTHFMDEADILADYKAIISHGKLRCAGSSLYLKNRFGIGYHLGMVVDPASDKQAIVELVTRFVPGSSVSRQHSKELAFRLPLSSVSTFSDLFSELERYNETGQPCSASGIGVISYGVSMTTLEEVFLKLDDQFPSDGENGANGGNNGELENFISQETSNESGRITERFYTESSDLGSLEMSLDKVPVKYLALQQLWALLVIRFKLSIRSFMKILFQVVIPPIFIIVGLVIQSGNQSQDPVTVKELNLRPSLYLKHSGHSGKDLTDFLIKNSTRVDIPGILQGIQSEGIRFELVKTLSNLLNKKPHTLAVDMQDLPRLRQLSYLLRYNDTTVHSIPVGINTVNNIVLRAALQATGKKYNGTSSPIMLTSKTFLPEKPQWTYDYSSFVSVLLISMCFALLPNGFSIMVVAFRQLGLRHQLRVNGTSRVVYWLHFILGDLVLYIFPIVLVFILIAAFDIKAFNSSPALGSIALLLLLYSYVSLLFSYCLSFCFNKWETIQNVMGTVLSIISLVPYIAISTTDMLSGNIKGFPVIHILHIVFLVIDPPYAIFGGLYYISRVWRVQSILTQSNDVAIPSSKYFEMVLENGVPPTFIVLFIQSLFYTWLLGVLDCWRTGGIKVFPFTLLCQDGLCSLKKDTTSPIQGTPETENADVKAERERVKEYILNDNVAETSVLVEKLSKQFGKKKVVNDVNFCVEQGEVLGLLGPNGAGKTTTMNMITSDFQPSKGSIFLGGRNVKTNLQSSFLSLGYCPQTDPLLDDCTLEEHLRCFALIKGVPRKNVEELIKHYMLALKITEHADKRAKSLSGGTKRKLCFLMSMMGNPNTVLLDEPSSGMDPAARRFLWTAISKNIKGQRGAILTTHSMEEADALCARVGIIVKGKLRCIGTTQELKSNYGGGYHIEIKGTASPTATDDLIRIRHFVAEIFPSATEVESFGTRLTFKVQNEDVKDLSAIFRNFEEGKRTLSIEEYSFSQATLEQVFLEFAKEQDDELTGVTDGGDVSKENLPSKPVTA